MKTYMSIAIFFVAGYLQAGNNESSVGRKISQERRIDRINPTKEQLAKARGFVNIQAYEVQKIKRPSSADLVDKQKSR